MNYACKGKLLALILYFIRGHFRFWNALVQYYPLWLAPNLITLIGLIVNLVTVLILSHYCYTATEEAPWWAYVQAALGLFIYQTLDATDGKQARRTNSSSPLGELFDHGCDSMTQSKSVGFSSIKIQIFQFS
jgi:hypothetical protein